MNKNIEKILDKLALIISLLPLTLFIVRHQKIGMEAPWLYIIFAAYAVLIIVGFVFAIYLVRNPKTKTALSKMALVLSSLYVIFFGFFTILTIASRLNIHL